MPTRPVWAEIARERLLANYQQLRRIAGPQADLMPVVKANAYGHGALLCAPPLAAAGAQWLGVTSAAEGMEVRAVCPQTRILLMSGIFGGEAAVVLDHALTPVVWEAWQLDLLEAEAAARSLPPATVAVHLEIDTGMSRQGARVTGSDVSPSAAALMARFHPNSPLRLEAVLTHFSAPETMYASRPNPQLAALDTALQAIVARGLHPRWLHAGNSSSLITGADRPALEAMAARAGARLMLRPGLALYGYLDRLTRDGISWGGEEPELAPMLAWKTKITSLRTLQAGETAGYGNTFAASAETRLALVPVGYADGLNRLLSNRGEVLLHGQRAPIAGRVSMDQTILDVTAIPAAAIGDEVVLLGSQANETVDAWELADLAETIPWEVLCAISSRVPRILV